MNTDTLTHPNAGGLISRARGMLRLLALTPMIYAAIAFAQTPESTAVSEKLVGVGIALSDSGGSFVVGSLIHNAPAAASKLIRVGDRILAVADGEEPAQPLAGKTLTEAVGLIRGKMGSRVRLTVARAGGEERDIREVLLTREVLKLGAEAPSDDDAPPDAAASGEAPLELAFERLPGGEADRLSNYRGKIVVLEFWATWSAPCQGAMAELESAVAGFKDARNKVVFITVSMDGGKAKPIARLKEKGWTETLNGWSGRDALAALKMCGAPTVYIIGADGRIIAENPRMNQQMLEDVIKPLLKE